MSVCSFVSAGLEGQKLSAEATERRERKIPRLSFMAEFEDTMMEVIAVCKRELRGLDLCSCAGKVPFVKSSRLMFTHMTIRA